MGLYIKQIDGNELPILFKADKLKMFPGVIEIPKPQSLVENLCIVVESEFHDAARYVKDRIDFDIVTRPDDRTVTWLLIPDLENRCVLTK